MNTDNKKEEKKKQEKEKEKLAEAEEKKEGSKIEEKKEKIETEKPKEQKEEVKEVVEDLKLRKEDIDREADILPEKIKKEIEVEVESWNPKTKLGKIVKEKKIKDINEIFEKNLKILEPEIVSSLLKLESDILFIGQSKGKFGGGKRRAWRQTQKKTAEGNVPTFSCMIVVGDKNGHIGLGYGRAKETVPARNKALRKAKLNIFKIKRGCGSFDCSCKEKHSIPFKVEGKCGSLRIILIPAPQGTGLVIGDECKKILHLAGIKDIYSKTFGQTRTTINLAKACIIALKKTNEIK